MILLRQGTVLPGYSAVARCKVLCSWQLQGLSAFGHCKDKRLGTGKLFCSWAQQEALLG